MSSKNIVNDVNILMNKWFNNYVLFLQEYNKLELTQQKNYLFKLKVCYNYVCDMPEILPQRGFLKALIQNIKVQDGIIEAKQETNKEQKRWCSCFWQRLKEQIYSRIDSISRKSIIATIAAILFAYVQLHREDKESLNKFDNISPILICILLATYCFQRDKIVYKEKRRRRQRQRSIYLNSDQIKYLEFFQRIYFIK